ncbi:hypothetical protein KIN20_003752 [Parelaphostrongylus tenuis]|uniref:Uncharacterized protein n=1 Tax=Parelaphostrongylus tenuis TaxID=148309 RepID=A0AAD5MIR7_PARTN|nr:hypothetical protein KIN20_003752 [Parelaphostrongylus tenuis]
MRWYCLFPTIAPPSQESSRFELHSFFKSCFLEKVSVKTRNIIIANWSTSMWQSVVNRAVQMLALGPLRSHFFSASASVMRN